MLVRRSTWILLLAALGGTSCQKANNSDGSDPSQPRTIELSTVSAQCLNIEKYAAAFKALAPQTPAAVMNESLNITELKSNRSAFKDLVTFSAFHVATPSVSELSPFDGFSQTDCSALTFTSTEGDQQQFKVTEATSQSIVGVTDDGRKMGFIWLDPQRLLIQKQYVVRDLPCSNSTATVEVQQVIDWSQNQNQIIDLTTSPIKFDTNFLKSFADLVGFHYDDLFVDSASASDGTGDSRHLLSFAKLKEMADQPAPPALLYCTAPPPAEPNPVDPTAPIPTPTPDPSASPTPAPTPAP